MCLFCKVSALIVQHLQRPQLQLLLLIVQQKSGRSTAPEGAIAPIAMTLAASSCCLIMQEHTGKKREQRIVPSWHVMHLQQLQMGLLIALCLLQERQMGEDGEPHKVQGNTDLHFTGLVLDWVYGTVVATADKARAGAKRPLGAMCCSVCSAPGPAATWVSIMDHCHHGLLVGLA